MSAPDRMSVAAHLNAVADWSGGRPPHQPVSDRRRWRSCGRHRQACPLAAGSASSAARARRTSRQGSAVFLRAGGMPRRSAAAARQRVTGGAHRMVALGRMTAVHTSRSRGLARRRQACPLAAGSASPAARARRTSRQGSAVLLRAGGMPRRSAAAARQRVTGGAHRVVALGRMTAVHTSRSRGPARRPGGAPIARRRGREPRPRVRARPGRP